MLRVSSSALVLDEKTGGILRVTSSSTLFACVPQGTEQQCGYQSAELHVITVTSAAREAAIASPPAIAPSTAAPCAKRRGVWCVRHLLTTT